MNETNELGGASAPLEETPVVDNTAAPVIAKVVDNAAIEGIEVSADPIVPAVDEQTVLVEAAVEEVTYTPNTTQTASVFVPSTAPIDDEDVLLNLPGDSVSRAAEVLNTLPNLNYLASTEGKNWANVIQHSYRISPSDDAYENTVNRVGADFGQYVDSDMGKLAVAEPRFKHNNGAKVTGERAVMRVRSLMGFGSAIQIPLWHSGFWITLKAPSEGSLLELQRRLIEEKVNLGRRTYGMSIGNNSVFINNWLLQFIEQHVYETSIKDDKVVLAKEIACLDWPTLVWGLALTIYRNGFPYARPCLTDPTKCNHVVKELINLSKIQWVDRAALSKRQITHMTNRGGSTMTLDAVHNYQNEFAVSKNRIVTLTDQLKMTLKIPNMEEHILSGQKWVNNIVSRVDNLFTGASDEDSRNQYISEQGQATAMRQYSHWVKDIIINDEEIIDDPDTVEELIDTLSADDAIREKYTEEIVKFMGDSTVSVIAIPNMDCPMCGSKTNDPMPRFPRLIPIETVPTFFTLLAPKLQRIRTR